MVNKNAKVHNNRYTPFACHTFCEKAKDCAIGKQSYIRTVVGHCKKRLRNYMTLYLKEFEKENGELIKFPQEFSLIVEETSNGVYQIEIHDKEGRSVSKQGVDLDNMVERSIEELERMKK